MGGNQTLEHQILAAMPAPPNAPELPPNARLALEWCRSIVQAAKVVLVTLALTIYHSCLALIPLKYYPKKSIEKQTVLITGAGSGLGRLLALKMADLGAEILIWDIDERSLNETLRLIDERKPRCQPKSYVCDLSQRDQIYRTAEKVKQEFQTIDILINNAGIVSGKDIFECPDEKIVKVMDVNTMAHIWMTKAFLPAMMERNSGHLVTIASAAGLMAVNGLADYCASKYAAVGFHEALDLEISAKGLDNVSLTLVCPYYIDTGMFEGVTTKFPSILPIMDPEYASQKIVDAILMKQKMLLLPRSIYFFNALKGILPTWVAHALSKNLELTDSMQNFVGRKNKSS